MMCFRLNEREAREIKLKVKCQTFVTVSDQLKEGSQQVNITLATTSITELKWSEEVIHSLCLCPEGECKGEGNQVWHFH